MKVVKMPESNHTKNCVYIAKYLKVLIYSSKRLFFGVDCLESKIVTYD